MACLLHIAAPMKSHLVTGLVSKAHLLYGWRGGGQGWEAGVGARCMKGVMGCQVKVKVGWGWRVGVRVGSFIDRRVGKSSKCGRGNGAMAHDSRPSDSWQCCCRAW